MNITNAKYIETPDFNDYEAERIVTGITVTIDGEELSVPLDPANRHYAAIMEQVNSGTLTVEPEYTDQELDQMEAAAQADAEAREAREAIKTSVINKIATNLTSEEKLWLEENL